MKRRTVLGAIGPALMGMALPAETAPPAPRMQVFKNASCGCCGAWVDHIRTAGFDVHVTEVDDASAARKGTGLSDKFGGCHTAIVGGYVVEGHVPATDVKRLLASRPAAIGLAVPGMPAGSPGMEAGSRQQPYEVLLIDKKGRDTLFTHYPKS